MYSQVTLIPFILALLFIIKVNTLPVNDEKSNQNNDQQVKNEQWLMKNIDQLLYEMKQFGHEYNVQVLNSQASEEKNQKSLAHDLAILRADHTVIANQQRNLITLIQKAISSLEEKSNEKHIQKQQLSTVHSTSSQADDDEQEEETVYDLNYHHGPSRNHHGHLSRRLNKLHRKIGHNSPTLKLHKLCRVQSEEVEED